MKRINISLSKKQWLLIISCMISFILAFSLHMLGKHLKQQLPHEQVANTWDKEGNTAHISVFFSEDEKYALKQEEDATQYLLDSWYYDLLTNITQASVDTSGVKNQNARSLVYGYHADGKVTLVNNNSKVEVNAYGVGGDFFQFHPIQLLYGSYFSQSDLMQDRIIIDTETAWQLFGSNDVVGMFVTIQNVPHMVVGVYERERGSLIDAAGNKESRVYVSHNSLYEYGTYHGLESVEYLLPNPVTGFARNLVNAECEKRDVLLVEHQNRFAFMSLLQVIKELPTRSMSISGITFPYWENMARSYEDILARLLIAECVFWVYLIIVTISTIWYLWLHRKWRAVHIYEKVKDDYYALSVRRYHKKQQKDF